jgi:hypothetical protein
VVVARNRGCSHHREGLGDRIPDLRVIDRAAVREREVIVLARQQILMVWIRTQVSTRSAVRQKIRLPPGRLSPEHWSLITNLNACAAVGHKGQNTVRTSDVLLVLYLPAKYADCAVRQGHAVAEPAREVHRRQLCHGGNRTHVTRPQLNCLRNLDQMRVGRRVPSLQ